MYRTIREGLLLAAVIGLACGAAFAQAPAPREIPEGFVLPGPAPTGPDPTGAAPAAPTPAPPPPAAPDAAAPALGPSTGSAAPAQTFVLPGAGATVRLSTGTAAGARHDWPCVQRRIDHVDERQVWTGPELAEAASPPGEAMRRLVETIVQRRVPLAEAEARAVDFVKALPEGERAAAATALYADLFRRLNAERTGIMRGIERYGARQRDLAQRLRETNAALGAIRAGGDAAKASQAQEALLWDTRIFEERRRSLSYVCEVPTLIEQRMFGLGRALAGTF